MARQVGANLIDGYYYLYYKDTKEPVPESEFDKYDIDHNGFRMNVGDYTRAVDHSYQDHPKKRIKVRKTNKKMGRKVTAVLFVMNIALASIVVKDHINSKTYEEPQIETTIDTSELLDNTNKIDIDDNKVDYIDTDVTYDLEPYECNCPADMQKEIYRICNEHNIDYNVMMCILDNESGGKFDNHGVINSTNDYGYAQINICNHDYIKDKLGYTAEDLLTDDLKCIDAAAFLLEDIYKKCDPGDYENIFGMYNGWINWRNKEISRNYSSAALEKLENKYNKSDEELEKIFGETKGVESYGRGL